MGGDDLNRIIMRANSCHEPTPPLEWRDIEGFEGVYQVSNYGQVRRQKPPLREGGAIRHRLLKPYPRGGKDLRYLAVDLSKGGKPIKEYVHRLVAHAFLSPPEEHGAWTVHHVNHDGTDNRVHNLQWKSLEENGREGARKQWEGR